jgi:hypothetical protein
MTSLAALVAIAPCPVKVDELARDYLEAKKRHFEAILETRMLQAELENKAEVLVYLARTHGLLNGVSWEIVAAATEPTPIVRPKEKAAAAA